MSTVSKDEKPSKRFAKTDLARLCRYYLACLGFEDADVSTLLEPADGEPDWFKLHSLPQTPEDLAESDGARKLLGRWRTERGRYGLYLGYPTHIAKENEEYTVEPILWLPIEREADTGRLSVDLQGVPTINRKPFRRFTNAEPNMLMNEMLQLQQELGLTKEEGCPIDEVAKRLRTVRDEWPWKEDIDPSGEFPTHKPKKGDGIYNRAVVLMAERSSFTQGLEEELKALACIPAREYAPTALGRWLSDDPVNVEPTGAPPPPLLEVLPMNSEQRQAVSAALTRPITIITGPPGTGKSQVVTNLLVNAARSGKRTLFASRNNKAVDVVEDRVNALGSRQTLLRMRQQDHQVNLAEYVLNLLSATTTDSEKEEFDEAESIHKSLRAEHDKLEDETRKFIALRNETDRLERATEDARETLGPELFAKTLKSDIGPITMFLWTITQKGRLLKKPARYSKALRKLQALRLLEEIARDDAKLIQRLARHSERLWKLWLRLQPSRLSAGERKKLGKYTTLLKMVLKTGTAAKLSPQLSNKYSEMLQDISDLIPCWAVTSLSARGRIPLDPGKFDLVVIDEASQCDIASALPLLYRAKSVAIIGDLKQLSHIGNLPRGQDQALLERYGLVENFLDWEYSHQSLFALGSTRTKGEDIIRLVDHHRSHADIIEFSNKEFYEEKLRVATNYNDLRFPNRSEPGVRWIDVKGAAIRPESGGAINMIEVEAVVATLCDLVLDTDYEGAVGIVAPFRAQVNAIREAINKNGRLASMLMQRDFPADTVHAFQGGERDVMVFSPVVSANFPKGALGFLRSNPNLFNVAITRARAQLIVVGDKAACESCDVGYLSRFATYAASLEGRTKETAEVWPEEFSPTYPNVANPDAVSDWERKFYTAAYKAGFRLIPQYNIEKYIVDFLMVKGERRLVIEIDGERYHRNWTGELCRRDRLRNQRLFELGYDVMRFWVYEVRDDMDGCLKRLEDWRDNKRN